ncbi:MAG: high-potential iron-sulfur protein [Pseudobdellovibrio sp.]
MNRRNFFKNIAGFSGIALIAPVVISSIATKVFAEEGRRKKAGAGPEMVDANDPVVKGVQYVADAKKSPAAKGNKCSTCMLYAKKDMKDGKEIGSCSIFPNKFVHADGFCNSWAKKA